MNTSSIHILLSFVAYHYTHWYRWINYLISFRRLKALTTKSYKAKAQQQLIAALVRSYAKNVVLCTGIRVLVGIRERYHIRNKPEPFLIKRRFFSSACKSVISSKEGLRAGMRSCCESEETNVGMQTLVGFKSGRPLKVTAANKVVNSEKPIIQLTKCKSLPLAFSSEDGSRVG